MKCAFCGQDNPEDEAFCEACGQELSGKTKRVDPGPMNSLPHDSFGPALTPEPIILVIGETHLKLNIEKRTIIGRADPKRSRDPDIDLTAYGARAHGVSRHHIQIEREDKILKITDLESTNGTYVNDDKVADCQLGHQDWVRIGRHVLIADLYETLSLDATIQMLRAEISGAADADGTMMLDMSAENGSQWMPLDYLNFLSGNQTDYELSNKPVTIGKNRDADIVVGGIWSLLAGQPSATITKQGNDYYIDHVAGLLKPKVNGATITTSTRLRHHDTIRLGPLHMQLHLMQ